jgi:hypothetical protein
MRLSEIMGRLDLTFWPQAALVIFLLVFAAVVVRLYVRSGSKDYEQISRIPIEDHVVSPRLTHAIRPCVGGANTTEATTERDLPAA